MSNTICIARLYIAIHNNYIARLYYSSQSQCRLAIAGLPLLSRGGSLKKQQMFRMQNFGALFLILLLAMPVLTTQRILADTRQKRDDPLSCPDPGIPLHGNRRGGDFVVGASVSYGCSAGYRLQGSTELICSSNGTWSSAVPQCTGEEMAAWYTTVQVKTEVAFLLGC